MEVKIGMRVKSACIPVTPTGALPRIHPGGGRGMSAANMAGLDYIAAASPWLARRNPIWDRSRRARTRWT
jgi:hypothetical protein